jgi:hypothetical protein
MDATVGRAPTGARRFGYLVAAAISAVMWYLINVRPGWEDLSFLTPETSDVLWLVNFSFAVSIMANLAYVFLDPRWFKAMGEIVTTSVGLIVVIRLWQVFPFDFTGYSFDWALVARIALGFAFFGSILGILVQIGALVRMAIGAGSSAGHGRPALR